MCLAIADSGLLNYWLSLDYWNKDREEKKLRWKQKRGIGGDVTGIGVKDPKRTGCIEEYAYV